MKVLIVHNYYQSSSPSGEDLVFENEANLLRNNDVAVVTYSRYNDEILNHHLLKKLKLVSGNIWSKKTYKEMKDLIKREKPDIAHLHNIFYLISPSAYYACKDMGIPAVQTLHNYRFFCINGLLLRDGQVCEKCMVKSPYYGAIRGCYRNSIIYSLPLSYMINHHQKRETWCKMIDGYIALTEFSRRKFIEFGLPEDKISVKPNFFAEGTYLQHEIGEYGAFLGRISSEKGLSTLIDAVKILNNGENRLTFKIIGDGPLRSKFEKKCHDEEIKGIEFLGRRKPRKCMEILHDAMFLVIPSVCYENFPMAIREAYALGKPVLASRRGALAEIVQDGKTGILFEPSNPEDLSSKIEWLLEHKDKCIEMGKNARKVFEEKYTAEKNFEILMNIYNTVLDRYGK